MVWCAACQRAVAWLLMTDSESPATLFELLYLFFPEQPMRIGYDNACNFISYALNRDPAWTALLRAFVDALHFKGHTGCANSFSSGTRYLAILHGCGTPDETCRNACETTQLPAPRREHCSTVYAPAQRVT